MNKSFLLVSSGTIMWCGIWLFWLLWVVCGLGAAAKCAKSAGTFGGESFLKMRRVGHYFSQLSNVNLFSQSPSCHRSLIPVGNVC